MGDNAHKQIETFCSEFEKIYSKGADKWTPTDVAAMKDFKKLEYYTKVIKAMDSGDDYPGSEHIENRYTSSYRSQPRNMHGRYMSYGGDWDMYNRRYYDSEWDAGMHKLRRMMDEEDNPQKRMAIQEIIRLLEDK